MKYFIVGSEHIHSTRKTTLNYHSDELLDSVCKRMWIISVRALSSIHHTPTGFIVLASTSIKALISPPRISFSFSINTSLYLHKPRRFSNTSQQAHLLMLNSIKQLRLSKSSIHCDRRSSRQASSGHLATPQLCPSWTTYLTARHQFRSKMCHKLIHKFGLCLHDEEYPSKLICEDAKSDNCIETTTKINKTTYKDSKCTKCIQAETDALLAASEASLKERERYASLPTA